MPLIDSTKKADISSRAQQSLVKRTLGGITQESAVNAIEKATNEAILEGNKRIGSLEMQVRDYNSAISVLQEKVKKEKIQSEELQSKLDDLNKRLASSHAIKTGKPRILPNGHIETIRVNRNGFRETTETLADGRKVSKKFETIDGDILKITYNPATGKPLKTFSNINGDTLTEYNGDKQTTKPVNNKKVAPKKPEIIATEMLRDESNRSNGLSVIRKSYSDGSYDMVTYSHFRQSPISETKINKDGKEVQKTEYRFFNDCKTATTQIYGTENHRPTAVNTKYIYDKLHKSEGIHILEEKKLLDNSNNIYMKVVKYDNGLTQIIKAEKDENGIYNLSNPSMKIIYPKDSKIKYGKISYYSQFYVEKETLKMKDGSTVTIKIDDNYDPVKILIAQGDGSQKELKTRQEIYEYLKSIGKNLGLKSSKYYNNSLL